MHGNHARSNSHEPSLRHRRPGPLPHHGDAPRHLRRLPPPRLHPRRPLVPPLGQREEEHQVRPASPQLPRPLRPAAVPGHQAPGPGLHLGRGMDEYVAAAAAPPPHPSSFPRNPSVPSRGFLDAAAARATAAPITTPTRLSVCSALPRLLGYAWACPYIPYMCGSQPTCNAKRVRSLFSPLPLLLSPPPISLSTLSSRQQGVGRSPWQGAQGTRRDVRDARLPEL